jgi:endonuclease-3
MLLEEFGGKVPRKMDNLLRLPGVARKTANVVRAAAFGLPAIITDTHFIRLSQRMGLTKNSKPEKIEQDLMALLPEDTWSAFSHAMLFHGRAVCDARKPACDRCVVKDLCPSALEFPHFEKPGVP